MRALAELAAKHNIALVSDEIYREFCYDAPFVSPARWNDQTIVDRRLQQDVRRDRLAAGLRPRAGGDHRQAHDAAAVHVRLRAAPAAVGGRRGARRRHEPITSTRIASGAIMVVDGLSEAGYERRPSRAGRFTSSRRCPDGSGTGSEFVARAIENELLIIPGSIFSRRDTHFRISYAASEATIRRGLGVLHKLRNA